MRGVSEAFHSPSLFRAHQITHAGKKQGEWKQCGKSFFQVSSKAYRKLCCRASLLMKAMENQSPIKIAFVNINELVLEKHPLSTNKYGKYHIFPFAFKETKILIGQQIIRKRL